MKLRYAILALAVVMLGAQAAERTIATMRGDTPISVTANPPRMPQVQNLDIRRPRNYPMQPPTIPHKIDDYQVDLNVKHQESGGILQRLERLGDIGGLYFGYP